MCPNPAHPPEQPDWSGPPPADRSGPPPAASTSIAPAREDDPPERYGPLEVRRLVKDDGRALLAYQRRPGPP